MVDRLIVTTSHLQTAIRRCVSGIENATSHSAVTDNVSRLAMYVVCSRMERLAPVLLSVPWKEAVDRYVTVFPAGLGVSFWEYGPYSMPAPTWQS